MLRAMQEGLPDRRRFLHLLGAAVAVSPLKTFIANHQRERSMFALIGRIRATSGDGGKLARVLVGGSRGLPGCHLYLVSQDAEDEDALWVVEVWESPEHHAASLDLPSVKAAIEQGRPLIEAFEQRTEIRPVGGLETFAESGEES